MKILVLGAGGTGGYFGGRLLQAGADVTFLVRERRAAQLATQGLCIQTPQDHVTLPAKTVLAADLKPEYDLVLLTCKAFDLASSIVAIAPGMHASTGVVPLLNGIAHLNALDQAFGKARVMGGSCQISAMLTRDGLIRSLTDTQAIVWGARLPAQKPLADRLGAAFALTNVKWKVVDNIMQEMWEKLVFLCTLAGMTTLMRANVGEILATPDGQTLMQRYLASCASVATHEGFTPRQEALSRFHKALETAGSPVTASMLRNMEGGESIEADHIVGFMRDKARKHGVDDALLTVAYTHLKAYENRRTANRLPPPV